MASADTSQQPSIEIDEQDWSTLQQKLSDYDAKREVVIKTCRDGQKLAKQAIYSLHRGSPADITTAAAQLAQVEEIAKQLQPTIEANPSLRYGSYAGVMEEYAEAMAFAVFLKEGRLIKASEMPMVDSEEYLGGILDFTGELNRWSVQRATARDVAAVRKCAALADAIMGRFLQFDLRNGNLRKKYDVLKYTVRKMENTLYELSLTRGAQFDSERQAADAAHNEMEVEGAHKPDDDTATS